MKRVQSVAKITRDVLVIAKKVKGKCAAGIKVGDKIIIKGPNISLEESDKVCGYAFLNLMPVIFAIRLGVDFRKLDLEGRLWQCIDPGPPYTEGGTVLFEVLPMEDDK
jgi:uncharacterized repeat protein (TIGR04076 family)